MGKLVSSTIPGLFNGVSQQAATMRLDTQGEIQENAMGTIVDGLYTRSHSEHVALLAGSNANNSFMHTINRDLVERYNVFITDDPDVPIEIYRLDGTRCTVRYGALDADLVFTEDLTVRDYLTTTDALPKAYKLLTIADYTLVVNRTMLAEMTTAVTTGTITDKVQTFLDLPNEWEKIAAWDVAKTYTKGDLAKGTDRQVYYFINNVDTAGKALTDTDYWRPEYTYCSEGEVYEISGDFSNAFDNYYVKYTGGSWDETIAPGIKYVLDAATMPHRLVRTDADEFTFAECLWEDRVVGDDISCPLPSFVGKAITNLTFFKNRLGFLGSDTFFLSRAGRYFEVFPETAIELLDDDPIDVLASSTRVVKLHSSIPFAKNLMVNSAQGQFSFSSSGTTLTPVTATITPTTAYETSPDSDPVASGPNIYFVNPREKYVSIMEYLIQPDTLIEDAANVTAHCPHFIPNGTVTMLSCVPMDMLLVYSDADRRSIYIYKYYWVGNEKPQSAWSKWTFDGDILGVGMINTTLYYSIKRGNEVALEKIQLENIAVNPDFTYRITLDRQVRIQGVYDDNAGTTSWTLPYSVEGLDTIKCINPVTGFPYKLLSISGNTIVATGDRTASMGTIGIPFRMRYRFSEWYVKDAKKVAIIDGKLQIRTLTVAYKNTGAFRLEVNTQGRDPVVTPFSGVRVGASHIGKVSLLTGEEKFLILARSKYTTIDIVSDSYLPCQFTTASFEGMYVARAERM